MNVQLKTSLDCIINELPLSMSFMEEAAYKMVVDESITIDVDVTIHDTDHLQVELADISDDLFQAVEGMIGPINNIGKWATACRACAVAFEERELLDLVAAEQASQDEYRSDSIADDRRMEER